MNEIGLKKAVIINFIAKYSNIIVQLILNAILARLLTPDDYGIVAIISVFITFFSIIADMGIGPAIIQNKKLSKEENIDIFTFTIYVAIFISILFCIVSIPISMIYSNKIYIQLGCITSIGIFFNVLNIVPSSLLYKEKRFKDIGIRTVSVTCIAGAITIVLAFLGAKYYAIIANSIVMAFIIFIWNYSSVDLSIKFKFNKESIRKIREFSLFQFGFNIINYFSRNLDTLLIGSYMNSSELGYYDKAYKLMLYPVQNLTFVISPVLHPILSDYQNDKERVYKEYLKVVKLLSLLGVFFCVFSFFGAREIIIIMFGGQWERSIGLFQILSISIWPQIVTSSAGSIFQSVGETKKLFQCGIITSIINCTLIIIGVLSGSLSIVAIGVTIGYIMSFIIAYFIMLKGVFKKSFIKFLSLFAKHLFIAAIMGLGLIVYNLIFDEVIGGKLFLSAIFKLVVAIVTYMIGLIITKEFTFLYNLAKGLIRRK